MPLLEKAKADFAKLKFHISDAEEENGGIYCVAKFESEEDFDNCAEELSFCTWEFEELDSNGSIRLDDNGSPFESVTEVQERLLMVFEDGINDGLIESSVFDLGEKGMLVLHPYGVDRGVLS